MSQQVYDWYHSDDHSAMLAWLTRALSSVAKADATGSPTIAGLACAHLASSVTAMLSIPPIPDLMAARWFTRALAELGKSAADCQAGAQSENVAMINEGTAAMSAGIRDMARATSAIKALSG